MEGALFISRCRALSKSLRPIAAKTIHSQRGQSPCRVPIIYGPGNDCDSGGPTRSHQRPVDQVGLLPQGAGTGILHRTGGINRIRCGEHAKGRWIEMTSEPRDDAMIERMDVPFGSPVRLKQFDESRICLGGQSFRLDEHLNAGERVRRLLQRRDRRPIGEPDGADPAQWQGSDRLT